MTNVVSLVGLMTYTWWQTTRSNQPECEGWKLVCRYPFMTGLIDMSANDGSSKLKLVSAAILLIGGIGFVT
ncbi:MAG TPA: hypothetical protein PK988_05550, partial [Candidatus Sumerlaeota bacterium]|nr:hypothetical protein [Candidatus Sumerlaeota bacterium]